MRTYPHIFLLPSSCSLFCHMLAFVLVLVSVNAYFRAFTSHIIHLRSPFRFFLSYLLARSVLITNFSFSSLSAYTCFVTLTSSCTLTSILLFPSSSSLSCLLCALIISLVSLAINKYVFCCSYFLMHDHRHLCSSLLLLVCLLRLPLLHPLIDTRASCPGPEQTDLHPPPDGEMPSYRPTGLTVIQPFTSIALRWMGSGVTYKGTGGGGNGEEREMVYTRMSWLHVGRREVGCVGCHWGSGVSGGGVLSE